MYIDSDADDYNIYKECEIPFDRLTLNYHFLKSPLSSLPRGWKKVDAVP